MQIGFIVLGFLLASAFLILLLRVPFVKRTEKDRWATLVDVPTLGGIALLLSSIIFILDVNLYLIYGAMLIFISGLMDDIVVYPVSIKLIFQMVAAINLAYAKFGLFGDPFLVVIVFLFALTLINSMNFIDNMNGIAAITAANAFLAFSYLYNNDVLLLGVGACIAFLIPNIKGKIFMGDCGSTLLGYTLAWLVVSQPKIVWHQSLVIVAFPLIDIAYVVINRTLHGRKPWVGGTDHLNHVIARKIGEDYTVVVVFLLTMLLGLTGFLLSITNG